MALDYWSSQGEPACSEEVQMAVAAAAAAEGGSGEAAYSAI